MRIIYICFVAQLASMSPANAGSILVGDWHNTMKKHWTTDEWNKAYDLCTAEAEKRWPSSVLSHEHGPVWDYYAPAKHLQTVHKNYIMWHCMPKHGWRFVVTHTITAQ